MVAWYDSPAPLLSRGAATQRALPDYGPHHHVPAGSADDTAQPQQHTLQAAGAMHTPAVPIRQEQRQLQQGLTQQQQARVKVQQQAAMAVQPAVAEGGRQDGAQLAEQAATNGQTQ